MVEKTISASELKAHCAKVLAEVERTRTPYVVTRRGRPIARLVPEESDAQRSLFGCLKGRIRVIGNIIEPLDVAWEAAK